MNKRIGKIILMTFLTATVTSVNGQEFYDTLQTEANRKYDCSFNYYDIDSLSHVFFESGNVKMQIDSSAEYQVMFSESNSWCSGPNCVDQIFQLKTGNEYNETVTEEGLAQSSIQRKKHFNCSKTFSGVDLIKKLEINLNDTLFNYFPSIVNNQDEYNGKWTVFSNETYLILRLVTVYIGNSSWGSEEYIYLKKVK